MKLKAIFSAVAMTVSLSAFAEVQIKDPYARAVPEGQLNSAAFMQIENTGNKDLAIVSGSSEASDVVELHTHTNDNGVMRMRKVDKIDLPAQQSVELKPGGLHVMLIGLKQGLNEGDTVELNLTFSDGTSQTIQTPVKKVMSMMHKHKH